MVYRIKFRLHGGPNPGKFVYNLPAGAELHLNPYFRPITGMEGSSYSMRVREGRTLVTLIDRTASWNGKTPVADIFEIRPGHILTVNGITVEILECPELAAKKNREITQFLDLKDLTNPIPVEKPVVTAPIEIAIAFDQDPPDRVVLPISLTKPEVQPEPARLSSPISKVARFAAKVKKEVTSSEGQILQRRKNLQKAVVVACMFAGLIVGANQLAQKYYFSFDDDDLSTVAVVSELPPRVNSPQRSLASVEAENIAPEVAQTSETPAEQEVAPASSVTKITASSAVPVTEAAPMDNAFAAAATEAKIARSDKEIEFISAIEEGNLKLVTRLVEVDGVSADFTLDELGRAPFLRAAANGRVSIMEYFLTKKVIIHAVDYHGNDALMWAAINGHERTTKFLLSQGFVPSVKREDGKTALVLARNYHQAPIEKVLLAVAVPREKQARAPASLRQGK